MKYKVKPLSLGLIISTLAFSSFTQAHTFVFNEKSGVEVNGKAKLAVVHNSLSASDIESTISSTDSDYSAQIKSKLYWKFSDKAQLSYNLSLEQEKDKDLEFSLNYLNLSHLDFGSISLGKKKFFSQEIPASTRVRGIELNTKNFKVFKDSEETNSYYNYSYSYAVGKSFGIDYSQHVLGYSKFFEQYNLKVELTGMLRSFKHNFASTELDVLDLENETTLDPSTVATENGTLDKESADDLTLISNISVDSLVKKKLNFVSNARVYGFAADFKVEQDKLTHNLSLSYLKSSAMPYVYGNFYGKLVSDYSPLFNSDYLFSAETLDVSSLTSHLFNVKYKAKFTSLYGSKFDLVTTLGYSYNLTTLNNTIKQDSNSLYAKLALIYRLVERESLKLNLYTGVDLDYTKVSGESNADYENPFSESYSTTNYRLRAGLGLKF